MATEVTPEELTKPASLLKIDNLIVFAVFFLSAPLSKTINWSVPPTISPVIDVNSDKSKLIVPEEMSSPELTVIAACALAFVKYIVPEEVVALGSSGKSAVDRPDKESALMLLKLEASP